MSIENKITPTSQDILIAQAEAARFELNYWNFSGRLLDLLRETAKQLKGEKTIYPVTHAEVIQQSNGSQNLVLSIRNQEQPIQIELTEPVTKLPVPSWVVDDLQPGSRLNSTWMFADDAIKEIERFKKQLIY